VESLQSASCRGYARLGHSALRADWIVLSVSHVNDFSTPWQHVSPALARFARVHDIIIQWHAARQAVWDDRVPRSRRLRIPGGPLHTDWASCGRPRQGVPPDLDSAESSATGGAFRGDRGCGNETTVRDSQSPKSGSGADLRFGASAALQKDVISATFSAKYSFSFAKSTSKHAVLTPFAASRSTTTRNRPAAPLSEASASATLRRFSAP